MGNSMPDDKKSLTEKELLESMKAQTPLQLLSGIGAALVESAKHIKNPVALAELIGYLKGITLACKVLSEGVASVVVDAHDMGGPIMIDGEEAKLEADKLSKQVAAEMDAAYGGPMGKTDSKETVVEKLKGADESDVKPRPGFTVIKGGNA